VAGAFLQGRDAACRGLAFGTALPTTIPLRLRRHLVGGGLVVNGDLFPGRSGYAGSIGSILVPGGRPLALISRASLYLLERSPIAAGHGPRHPAAIRDWSTLGRSSEQWLDNATDALSFASARRSGRRLPGGDDRWRAAVRRPRPHWSSGRGRVPALDVQGVAPVDIVEGTIGADARVLGAASTAAARRSVARPLPRGSRPCLATCIRGGGRMHIGVDWGGTKIEGIALREDGREVLRLRQDTPRGDYAAAIG